MIIRGPAKYYGHSVSAALSAASVDIRDSVSAGAGTVIDSIAASAAIGTGRTFSHPVQCTAGLYIDFGGTGTVTVYYEGDSAA